MRSGLPNHSYIDPDPFSVTRNEKTANSYAQYDQKKTIEQWQSAYVYWMRI